MLISSQTEYDSALVFPVHPKPKNDDKNHDNTKPY